MEKENLETNQNISPRKAPKIYDNISYHLIKS